MEEIGWLLFIQKTVASLAWPVAFLIVSLAFRKEVAGLLRRLKALKVSGAEVGFSELLDEASREAVSVVFPDKGLSSLDIDESLVSKHPHFAVIESWRKIEADIAEVLRRVDPDIPRRELNGFRSLTLLRKSGLVAPEVISLLEDLRQVRNAAVHDEQPQVTQGQALEFLSIANRVADALKSAKEAANKD